MLFCMGCMEQYEDQLSTCPFCGYAQGMPAREAYHMLPESILRGRYIVGRVLGFGGFGVTYIGWDAQLERKVAIKEFLPTALATRMPGNTAITVYGGESTAQFRDGLVRFADEAQRLAKFNGLPGIVDIYDSFSENNTGYIVMQFLEGQDIKDILNAEGPMPYNRAMPIIRAVTETLEQVHAQGIIHRDIAPDNIYITNTGEVKLLDFGAARYESALNSKSLSVILKPGYAPEEQYRSQGEQGSWTDVYALAATFYKMITGITPEDSMERAVSDDLKEPSKHGAELPKAAENAIMNALNIRAEHRTKTMLEFRQALVSFDVVRAQVKQKKQKQTKVPTWLKIILGGTVAALLLFGILSATGTVQLGGMGNVPDGMVNTPGLINRQESEADQVISAVGLAYSIAGKDFNDKVEEGKIFKQEPQPGALIELGGTIRLWVSGGSTMNMSADDVIDIYGQIDSSKIPDLTLYTFTQAVEILSHLDIPYAFTAEYSNTLEPGLVISSSFDEHRHRVDLLLSAGKKPDPTQGPVQPIALGFTAVKLSDSVTAGEFVYIVPYDERSFGVYLRDTIYIPLMDGYTDYIHTTDEYQYTEAKKDEVLIATFDMPAYLVLKLSEDIKKGSVNYEDSQIRFSLENFSRDPFDYKPDPVMSPIAFDITYPQTAEVPVITGIELVSDPVRDFYTTTIGTADYQLSGNFREGKCYIANYKMGQYLVLCKTDGLLDVSNVRVYLGDEKEYENHAHSISRVDVAECLQYTISDATGKGVLKLSHIGSFDPSKPAEDTLVDTTGMACIDAIKALRQPNLSIYPSTEFSDSIPVGTIIRQEYNVGRLDLIVSAGREPEPGVIAPPIFIGINVIPTEHSYNGLEITQLMCILPGFVRNTSNNRIDLWIQPVSGPFAGRWINCADNSVEKGPSVALVDISQWLCLAVIRKSGGELAPALADGMMYRMAVTTAESRADLVYEEIPDAQKTEISVPLRLHIDKDSLLTEFTITGERPEGKSSRRIDYTLETNFGAYHQFTALFFSAEGHRIGTNTGYPSNIQKSTFLLTKGEGEPSYVTVYVDNGASLAPDGTLDAYLSYDKLECVDLR